MKRRISAISLILLSLFCTDARASHIVGGDFSYRYIKDTLIFGESKMKYEVTLYIYQDCITGVPDAIAQDNPAFFTVYQLNPGKTFFQNDTNIFFDPSGSMLVPANFSNECVKNIPPLCLQRKKFTKTYYLPPSDYGYIVVYQRCCRNASLLNVQDAGNQGTTYFCIIPPSEARNNSALFKNYPPQIICLNTPLYYDHSATDPDGDSLSYEFCAAQQGANDLDIKPKVAAPPDDTFANFYPDVPYASSYSPGSAMNGFPPITIDPITGIMTGTPNRAGRFLVTVCCTEWRNGVPINIIKREFQFVVTDCSKVVVADIPVFSNAPNTYIVNCVDHKVRFVNKSSGGFAYKWDFGIEGGGGTSTEFEPTFIYPDTGTFNVKLVVNPTSTCPDSITRLVKIYPTFHSAFTDSGNLCPGIPIHFADLTSSTIKPISSWKWTFGDGGTSTEQNPVHVYAHGGTYNVVLTSENIKNCIDTTFKRVIVQDFRPYAGDDTIIVKGEAMQFDAKGGTFYAWKPLSKKLFFLENFSDTSISNPRAIYRDTGIFVYSLFVQSDYGCSGYDTITVWVVDHASFVVPNAFTPNGDGRNDVFRPKAVGYSGLKFFKVFNRWGQEVYFGKTLEQGWDGTVSGLPGEIGVYYWQISYTDRFGKDGYLKGDVTLLR